MKLKSINIFLLGLLFYVPVHGQGLRPGQAMPKVEVGPMMNYHSVTANFSDWKGKLVILDFWSVTCGACLAGFPKLEKLQEQFGSAIQIILVSEESKDSVMRFYARRNRLKIPNLPMLTGDSLLKNLFPHVYKPHQVWIDGAGKVRYITDGYNATEANVQKLLEGGNPDMAEKKYEKEFAISDPLSLLTDERWREKVEYYSLLMHNISGVSIGNGISSTTGEGKPNRIIANGQAAVQLFARAYAEGGKYNFNNSNTIALEVPNAFPYQWPKDDSLLDKWIAQYCYNYVLQVPAEKSGELFSIMQTELCSYFNLDAAVEKRKVKCLILSKSGKEDKLATKGLKSGTNLWTRNKDSMRYIYNRPFSNLTTKIKNMISGKSLHAPFIDATGYSGNIDIEITAEAFDYADISLLQKELSRYGLELCEREWETDVLVIRRKG